jgi:tripartite-type tricarboxylate transporter receptor subunit TctC
LSRTSAEPAAISAWALRARAEGDGYTILLATNAYSVNASLYKKIPYDPLKDFVGVSELATSPNTFVVRSELPAKTIKEFVALARANPDKYQLCNAADRNHAADPAEVLKMRGKAAKT